MVKKYIEGESKEQRKFRKEQEKLSKLEEINEDLPLTKTNDAEYNVLCLKHGTKYTSDYVNRLYNMVNRHCTLDFNFVCLTDDSKGIINDIKTLPLPRDLTGWWCKPYMFSKNLPLTGTILYMDLDVVIANSIDKLFTYETEYWCTIRDFTRAMRPQWQKYNSSIIRFKAGELHHIWEEFSRDPKGIQSKHFGDQDFLYEVSLKNKKPKLFPDDWIQSWKWEIRNDRTFEPGGIRGNRKFRKIERVTPPPQCCVCVFHGDPNPHNCEDPWVIDNWK